jgi:hypothetical protein
MIFYIAFVFYLKILVKGSINKRTIFFGIIIICIGIFLIEKGFVPEHFG